MFVAGVHVGDLELQREAPAGGVRHRAGHHGLHPLSGEEREDGTRAGYPGKGITTLDFRVKNGGIKACQSRNIVGDQAGAGEVWLHGSIR